MNVGPVNKGPLLNWAIATGRINAAHRLDFVVRMTEGHEPAVIETLLTAPHDPKKGDFPPPWPYGTGEAKVCEKLETAKVAAARGRSPVEVKAASVPGAKKHRPAVPYDLRAPGELVARASERSGPADVPAYERAEATAWGGIELPDDVPPPTGQPPTLFPSGDLPLVTASGLDPNALLNVPWQARQAVAAAKTSAEAYELMERYAGPDGDAQAEIDAMNEGPLAASVADYEFRVSQWASRP